jgi:hypothetical protein
VSSCWHCHVQLPLCEKTSPWFTQPCALAGIFGNKSDMKPWLRSRVAWKPYFFGGTGISHPVTPICSWCSDLQKMSKQLNGLHIMVKNWQFKPCIPVWAEDFALLSGASIQNASWKIQEGIPGSPNVATVWDNHWVYAEDIEVVGRVFEPTDDSEGSFPEVCWVHFFETNPTCHRRLWTVWKHKKLSNLSTNLEIQPAVSTDIWFLIVPNYNGWNQHHSHVGNHHVSSFIKLQFIYIYILHIMGKSSLTFFLW